MSSPMSITQVLVGAAILGARAGVNAFGLVPCFIPTSAR